MPPFGSSIRSEFLLRSDITFLNNGSFGATPRVVLDAQRRWQEQLESQPIDFVMRVLPRELRSAADVLAGFMGASGEDMVFVENASTGVSSVIHSLIPTLSVGDELLTTSHVYNAVRQTMKHVCGLCGARYVEVDIPFPIEDSERIVELVAAAITPRTRFALFDHVTSPTGIVFPVEHLIALCRSHNIRVMIDGAHAPAMLDLHLDKLGADWYTGNFHKWLFAPKGSAFLWTRKEVQAITHPLIPSHGYLQGYVAEFDFCGTKDWSSYLSATEGLKFFESLGADAVRHHNNSLARAAHSLLIDALPQPEPCPETMLASLASIVLPVDVVEPMKDASKIHDTLWNEHKIEVPIFPFGNNLLLRVAAQVYNSIEQYELLANTLRAMFRATS